MKFLLATFLTIALVSSVAPLTINCDWKIFQTDFGNAFGCDATEVIEPCSCNSNSTTDEELNIINPEDLPADKKEEDLEYLRIKDLNVTDFPRRLRRKFWRLKGIEFDGTDIGDLRSSYFEGLDFLLTVKFPRSKKLKKLPGRLFRWNFNIRWIDFEGSIELKNVGFNLFKHLRWLRRFNIVGSGCGTTDVATSNGTDNSAFIKLAQELWGKCPPDEQDMIDDMENMQCEFDNSKGGSKESKENSKGN